MEQRKLGTSELHVSAIGLGCVTFGREIDRETAWGILDHAAAVGINLLDTAEVYGDGASEVIIGEWLAAQAESDRPILATKVHRPLTRDHIERAAEQSLRRLGVDRLDLLQLHAQDDHTPLGETCDALASLQARGLVAHTGCSNFSAEAIRRALRLLAERDAPPMASVQPRYNLVSREIEADLLPLCQSVNLGVLAYSPLGAGFLTGKYRPDQPPPTGSRFDVAPGHRDLYYSDESFRTLRNVMDLANDIDTPVVELALAWVMRQTAVTTTLIGVRNIGQIDQALRAHQLDPGEAIWRKLDAASS